MVLKRQFMNDSHRRRICCLAMLLLGFSPVLNAAPALAERVVNVLDGQWEIAEGSMGTMPARFDRRVPVPGLVDEARPSFAGVGQPSVREAFWYRRTFKVKGEVPAVECSSCTRRPMGRA